MDSVYSKFFNGVPKNYSLGSVNNENYPQRMNRSASTNLLGNSVAPPLPGVLQNRNYNNDLSIKLQFIEDKINRIEEKNDKYDHLNALYNSQFLPRPVYYPLIGQQPLHNALDYSDPCYYGNSMNLRDTNGIRLRRNDSVNSKTKKYTRKGVHRLKQILNGDNTSIVDTESSIESKINRNKAKFDELHPDSSDDDTTMDGVKTILLKLLNQGKCILTNINDNLPKDFEKEHPLLKERISQMDHNYIHVTEIIKNQLNLMEYQIRKILYAEVSKRVRDDFQMKNEIRITDSFTYKPINKVENLETIVENRVLERLNMMSTDIMRREAKLKREEEELKIRKEEEEKWRQLEELKRKQEEELREKEKNIKDDTERKKRQDEINEMERKLKEEQRKREEEEERKKKEAESAQPIKLKKVKKLKKKKKDKNCLGDYELFNFYEQNSDNDEAKSRTSRSRKRK